MDRDLDALLGFAPDYDAPIPYMQRTREYYAAIGYTTPYRWAHHIEAPFTPLRKPLAVRVVTIVTTAAPYQPEKGDQGPGAPYNGGAKFYQVYSGDTSQHPRSAHLAHRLRPHPHHGDRQRHLVPAARPAARRGHAAASAPITPRFHGAPTNRSHRVTVETDAPEILRRCREDGADAAILVPNCPVCHQTCSLVARHLEANGIPTVVMGCAKDIVEHAAVPRFLFSDFPLGNSAGKPHDVASQDRTLELALRVLEAAPGPRTTMQSPLRWSEDASWKLDYLNLERIAARGTGPAPARVRRAEGDRAGAPRGEGCVMDRPPPPNPLPQGEGEDKAKATPPPLAGGGWGEGPAVTTDPRPFANVRSPRLHPGARRPLWQLSARPARRRCDQGRTARGRGHAPHAALARVGRPRHGAVVARDQRQQAQPHARSAKARGDRDRQPARRASRCGDGELPPRRDGSPRHRLRTRCARSIRG